MPEVQKLPKTNYGSAAPFFFYSSVLVATTLPSQILMKSNWFVCHRPPLGGPPVSPGFIVPQNSEVGTRLEFFGQRKSRSEGGARVEGCVLAPTLFSLSGVQDGTTLPERLPFCFLIKDRCSRSHYILFLCQRVFKIARGCYPGHPDARLNFVQQGSEKVHFSRGEDFFFSPQCLMLSPALKNMIYFFFSGFAPTPSAGGANL